VAYALSDKMVIIDLGWS